MPYYIKLPDKFLYWWLVKTPLKILKIGTILLSGFNNTISFTDNVRLLFVPLFGLTNFTGRMVSFFTRIFMIFTGMILMFFALIALIISPIIWLVIPFFIFKASSVIYVILYFIFLYLVFIYINLNKPSKTISQISTQQSKVMSFRPKPAHILKNTNKDTRLILLRLFEDEQITHLLKKCELDIPEFKDKAINSQSSKIDDIVGSSFEKAKANSSRYVELEHLFLSIVENIPNINTLLSIFNSNFYIIEKSAFWIVNQRESREKLYPWQDGYKKHPSGGIGKGMLGRVTPNLDKISTDITKQVKKGSIKNVIGRDAEIKQIANILDNEKNDVLMIGESGVGKTTIINGIAYEIMTGTEHKTLKNKRVVSIDVGLLTSESKESGNVSDKISLALEEADESGDIILFVDEIQNLITGMGEEGGYDSTILSILENHVSKNRIRLIGAISISNYRKYIEPNSTISRLFHIVKIEENSREDTINIMEEKAEDIEFRYGVFVTLPAIISCIDLSEKLIEDRVLPDKAIDVLERAVTTSTGSTNYVTSDVIEKEISSMTNIPVTAISESETDKLLTLEEKMKNRVIGQNQAIEKITSAIQRSRVGMKSDNKPIAGFLFAGMTGVGKTETAKSLSEIYFGDEGSMIRLDMSEYQQVDSINRIIGSPDGNTSGSLAEKVRNNPFCVVLIDEIEKAHPNILLTFLQMLDEGKLTDTSNREASFRNTIIIATSNVGTKSIQEIAEKGGDYEQIQSSAMIEIRENFAPELLNRFTAIIIFNQLSMDNLRDITKILLKEVEGLSKEKGVDIKFKPELIDELIRRGYSTEWGARPLLRTIEDTVGSYIAVKMLKKEINPGDRIILGTEIFNI